MTLATRCFLIGVLFLLAGCSTTAELGEACTGGQTTCASGLSCIQSGGRSITDGGLSCIATDLLCSKPCAADADCASLGAGHICVKECFGGSCLRGSRSP